MYEKKKVDEWKTKNTVISYPIISKNNRRIYNKLDGFCEKHFKLGFKDFQFVRIQ